MMNMKQATKQLNLRLTLIVEVFHFCLVSYRGVSFFNYGSILREADFIVLHSTIFRLDNDHLWDQET